MEFGLKLNLGNINKFSNYFITFLVLILVFGFPSKLYDKQPERVTIIKDFLKERQCALEVVWFEARGESKKGMQAVLDVVKNRKNSKGFGETICKVVHQQNQFSYRNHLKPGQQMPLKAHRALDKETLDEVSSVVDESLLEASSPVLEPDTLYFLHKDARASWTKGKSRVRIGNHVFLKE